ncbi:cAMP-binding protein [Chryseobacterium angstadtii]|uniref:cAMP-binding protein n=1 Tax=Chryseobacterium angstadtii TaxID=558151 RepID=A0A0J7IFG0_9FLAO|nr:Crp/Fnr family transcriptional regulator [Chryseobacterium angstadtii]KMQ65173.1 cAMP-binding protein [Chryseobacterium angstadtii]
MVDSFFRNFGVFSEQEISDIQLLFETRKVSKNDFFVQEGDHCREIAFIVSGIFRSYYISDDGKDITYCFRFPDQLMAAYSSFISDTPSRENMQAITDSHLMVLKKEAIDTLVKDDLNWTKFLKMIAEEEYLELEKRFFLLQRDTAARRYETLLDNQPDYVQKIPLQYLASYLGITQRHLSRIRKEISI